MEEKTFKKYQLWLEEIRAINSDDYNILSSFSEEEINDAFYKGSTLCCNDVHVNFDKDVVLNSIATDGEKIFINVYNKDEYLNYYTSQGFVNEPKLHSYILEI